MKLIKRTLSHRMARLNEHMTTMGVVVSLTSAGLALRVLT